MRDTKVAKSRKRVTKQGFKGSKRGTQGWQKVKKKERFKGDQPGKHSR
jgi:hypothetical protein